MFKKTGLVSLLLAIISVVALGQEGQWRHFSQINPDTAISLQCKLVNTANNLWAVWSDHVYSSDTAFIFAARFKPSGWGMTRKLCHHVGEEFSVFTNINKNAHVTTAFTGVIPSKDTLLGPNRMDCSRFDTIWSQLIFDDKAVVGASANSFDSTVFVWQFYYSFEHSIQSKSYNQGWGSGTTIVSGEEGKSNPKITCDKNGKWWIGWEDETWFDRKNILVVNFQTIDTSYTEYYSSLSLTADSIGKVWAFWVKNGNLFYRVNESGLWNDKELLLAGYNVQSVTDKNGIIWVGWHADSLVYVNSFNGSNWDGSQPVATGAISQLALDQMGNPCILWSNSNIFYSAIYCRDTIAPWVQITSPVADSTYYKGQNIQLQFNHSNDVAFLNVYCQREGQSEWQNIFDMISKDSLVNWTVPDDSANYRFKAEAIDSGWNEAVDSTGWFLVSPQGIAGKPSDLPVNFIFGLKINGPNPFKKNAKVTFAVDKMCNANISIYNSLGQLVKVLYNDKTPPGNYQLNWNGCDDAGKRAAAGVYICRLSGGGRNSNIKLIKVN
ncbi:MAG: FlgD immunoglobulin-like domain containing protein [Candidatus Edwardsbacteria bacterium]|nr:FlgD immunoglobulin-like domain containing protein [Candidatus Edwardsbacteria bacterium]